jgi:hypothetical protein
MTNALDLTDAVVREHFTGIIRELLAAEPHFLANALLGATEAGNGTWTTNSDGSVTFNGTVQFPNGTNLASGAGVVIFGPDGGVANFPAVEQGEPGLPPTLNFTINQLPATTALPSPNPAVTVSNPGGPGVASVIDVVISLNSGEQGPEGVLSVLSAVDLENTPSAGDMIGFDAVNNKAQWQPIYTGSWDFLGGIGATESNTQSVKNMGSLAIPAQPFAWWPEVYAQGVVIGAVDTQVNLVARINSDSVSTGGGIVCAQGLGAAGAAPPPISVIPMGLQLGTVPAAGSTPTTPIIPAGTAVTIFLNAENQTASANAWNTAGGAWMQVKVGPIVGPVAVTTASS